MIKVYFDSGRHAELVAVFEQEDLFVKCLHVLGREAIDSRMVITTSEVDASLTDLEDKRVGLQH